MQRIISSLPDRIKSPLRYIRGNILNVPYYGWGRWCPVCERSSRKFRKAGTVKRDGAKCVHCGALERHRFVWLFFLKMTDLYNGKEKKFLHVAPERCFEKKLKGRLGNGYITADLFDASVMIQMDITDIQFPDKSFDVIYCSHVLEHVQDDKRAMKEFRRVLKDNGWAILLVPITVEKTFEDAAVLEPSERQRLFGQSDHVRRYGLDYIDRLRESGFQVTITQVSDMFKESDASRMGLTSASGEIFFCTKT